MDVDERTAIMTGLLNEERLLTAYAKRLVAIHQPLLADRLEKIAHSVHSIRSIMIRQDSKVSL